MRVLSKNWKNKLWITLGIGILGFGTFFITVFATHTFTSPIADSHPFSLFTNWQSWANTQYPAATDKVFTPLYLMGQDGLRVNHSTSGYSTPRKYSLVDINGDALIDLLYHNASNIGTEFYAVLLNTGSGYNPIYKCVFANRYYGDCAGTGTAHPYNALFNSLSTFTTTPKPNDPWFQFLYLTGIYNRKPHGSESYGETQTANSYDLMDVNGDGLTDMVYRDASFAAEANISWPDNSTLQGAIFLNEGGTGWQLTYRCKATHDKLTTTVTEIKYYGDCANF